MCGSTTPAGSTIPFSVSWWYKASRSPSCLKGSYLRDPAVTVSIAEYRPFFLYGEVQKPGGIPYQPDLTVERAIALAGGFTERASRSKIEVVRASDPKHKAVRIELSDPVYPGDVITVKQSFF